MSRSSAASVHYPRDGDQACSTADPDSYDNPFPKPSTVFAPPPSSSPKKDSHTESDDNRKVDVRPTPFDAPPPRRSSLEPPLDTIEPEMSAEAVKELIAERKRSANEPIVEYWPPPPPSTSSKAVLSRDIKPPLLGSTTFTNRAASAKAAHRSNIESAHTMARSKPNSSPDQSSRTSTTPVTSAASAQSMKGGTQQSNEPNRPSSGVGSSNHPTPPLNCPEPQSLHPYRRPPFSFPAAQYVALSSDSGTKVKSKQQPLCSTVVIDQCQGCRQNSASVGSPPAKPLSEPSKTLTPSHTSAQTSAGKSTVKVPLPAIDGPAKSSPNQMLSMKEVVRESGGSVKVTALSDSTKSTTERLAERLQSLVSTVTNAVTADAAAIKDGASDAFHRLQSTIRNAVDEVFGEEECRCKRQPSTQSSTQSVCCEDSSAVNTIPPVESSLQSKL